MRMLPASIALALATLVVACDGGAGTTSTSSGAENSVAQADLGEVLAEVNGLKIGSKEFEEAAARKQPASGDALSAEEKQEVLDRLIEEKLLYQKALKLGLDSDPKVQKVMVNTLLRQEVYSAIRNSDFTDDELQAYYNEHKDDFVVPEKAQVKRILVKITDERPEADAKAEADGIHAELKADIKQFKELAAKHSEDPYRRRGGDVGFVPRSGKPGLDQAVVDKAFELDVDTLSEPFKTSEGFNLIYVANRRDRVERTFQQMKGSVLRKVKNERLKEMYEKYVTDLRQSAQIRIDQDQLALVEIKSSRKGPGLSLNPAMKKGKSGPGAEPEGTDGTDGTDGTE